MQYGLLPCDRDQTQAYVESSNPRNISLYKRLGFELLGTIQVGSNSLVVFFLAGQEQLRRNFDRELLARWQYLKRIEF